LYVSDTELIYEIEKIENAIALYLEPDYTLFIPENWLGRIGN
jgi:hypothetical protein